MTFLFGTLMLLSSLFLIMLVLVQRGRGGGLAGALGGMGGQSAFGTKAGDVFTRITIGAALVWFVLLMAAVVYFAPSVEDTGFGSSFGPSKSTSGATGAGAAAPTGGTTTPATATPATAPPAPGVTPSPAPAASGAAPTRSTTPTPPAPTGNP